MTIDTDTVLVYLGNIDHRYPRDEQLAHCKKAVKEMELPAIGRGIYEHYELDELIADNLLGRELLMLPKLSMLAVNRERDIGNRFLMNLLRVTNKAMVIMDVHEGLTSYGHDEWIAHVIATRNKLVNSRPMSSEGAKVLRALSNPLGLEKHWTEHVKKAEPERFKQMTQHWRDPGYNNAQEAIDASPDDELKLASIRMWERIFGGRTAGRITRT